MAATDSLTKDTIATPQLWRLSMLLNKEQVEVVLNSSMEDHALIHRLLPLDQGMSPLAAFEDLIYENPLLLSDFKQVDLLIDTPCYTFLPTDMATEEAQQAALEALWPDAGFTPVANALPELGETLVMGVDKGLLAFVRRTFLDTEPLHPIAALAKYFYPLSHQGNTSKLYAHLRPDAIDVVVIGNSGPRGSSQLRVACSYQTPTADDAAYYILAAAKTAGLSLQHDELRLCGDQQMREEVAPKLRQAASYVMPVIFPSEIFRAGREAIDAPFPLTILPLIG
ncbi:MAG: DUF3822 family protein [Bacteroidales bacterium]|nr:DUF3822 family protein [Bacteroidales bacterium]